MIDLDDDGRVQVSQDRKTVWVHGADGSTVGRFSKVFGMDVHTTITEQLAGAKECLRCTHETPGQAEWDEFCDLMAQHYGVTVDRTVLTFEPPAAVPAPFDDPDNSNRVCLARASEVRNWS